MFALFSLVTLVAHQLGRRACLTRQVVWYEKSLPTFVDALAAQGGKPLYELSYADARKVLEDAQAIPVTKLPADIKGNSSGGWVSDATKK